MMSISKILVYVLDQEGNRRLITTLLNFQKKTYRWGQDIIFITKIKTILVVKSKDVSYSHCYVQGRGLTELFVPMKESEEVCIPSPPFH